MLTHLAVVAILAAAASSASAQVLRGTIVDAQSSRQLPAADIGLIDARGQRAAGTRSDSAGAFQFELPQPGAYQLQVNLIGYATFNSEAVPLRQGETIDVLIRLSTVALPLTPLVITARRRASDRLAEFERRRTTFGTGHFISRADIERRPIATASELLIGAPYVSLIDNRILFPGTIDEYCRANVYIDGQLITRSIDVDDLLISDWIEGIEVYPRAGVAPAEYQRNDCGSILFWTREPRAGGRWTRVKIAVAALFAMGTILLIR